MHLPYTAGPLPRYTPSSGVCDNGELFLRMRTDGGALGDDAR
jgi:hypothetical protein